MEDSLYSSIPKEFILEVISSFIIGDPSSDLIVDIEFIISLVWTINPDKGEHIVKVIRAPWSIPIRAPKNLFLCLPGLTNNFNNGNIINPVINLNATNNRIKDNILTNIVDRDEIKL